MWNAPHPASEDAPCRAGAAPDGPVRLRSLTIELTERCQNACPHCYINRRLDDPCRGRELDTAAWQDIFRQAAALGVLTLHLTGGEPLIRDDFPALYEDIRRQGMRVRLSTNARAVTPALVELFARIPPLHPLEITVYGMSPASYDAAAGLAGAYADFQRGLALLRDASIPFGPTFVVLPANRQDLPAFEAWAAALPGVRGVPPVTTHLDLRVRQDDPARARRIDALRMSPEERTALLGRHAGYRAEMQRFCRFIGPAGDVLFDCGALQDGVIDAYGFLLPCLSVRTPAWTIDLRDMPLREAVPALRARLRAARATHPAYLDRCARCFLHGLCEMCPGKAWTEHGTLDTPVEYFCALAHAQARDLGLLAEGERAWDVQDGAARAEAFGTGGVTHDADRA